MLKIIIYVLFFFSITSINLTNAESINNLTQALSLTPDIKNGKVVFNICSNCHGIEGWGSSNGDFPQLAGQHQSVILKQIFDIRSGKRENPAMLPVIMELSKLGEQAIVNVAAYIETLKMDPEPVFGETDDEALKPVAAIYIQKCASCHGNNGEGMADNYYPLLQGQNYDYLLRQLQLIQSNKRKNSNQKMQEVISKMTLSELELLADFISRLEPEDHKIALDD